MQPQHPGLKGQQQGDNQYLAGNFIKGNPTTEATPTQLNNTKGLGTPNPYVVHNEALAQANERLTGEAQMKLAQARKAGAQAGKAEAEANIIRGLGAMGKQVQEQQQAEQDKLMMNQITSALQQGAAPDQLIQQGADLRAVKAGVQYMQEQQQLAEQQARVTPYVNEGVINYNGLGDVGTPGLN